MASLTQAERAEIGKAQDEINRLLDLLADRGLTVEIDIYQVTTYADKVERQRMSIKVVNVEKIL